jgi:hypothetical protein
MNGAPSLLGSGGNTGGSAPRANGGRADVAGGGAGSSNTPREVVS